MKLIRDILTLCVTMLLFLAGCSALPAKEEIRLVTPTEKPKSTDLFLETQKIKITSTPVVFGLSTPSPIARISPIPTLSNSDSESYVKLSLENNGNCSLPCIWGITPGKSSYQDVQEFFSYLGWKGGESHGVYYSGKDIENIAISVRVGIYAPNGEVEKIHFGFGGKDFVNYIKSFSFENILKILGKPSKVLAFMNAGTGESVSKQTSFELLLYYETSNILIKYTGTANKVGDNYRLCPEHPNENSGTLNPLSGNVDLYIGEPNKISDPDEIVSPFWILPTYYISFEKAFGITLDDFYNTIVQGEKNLCLISPQNIWFH